MFWQENPKKQYFTPPNKVQDAVFNISSKILPIDHVFLLSQALLKHLPWLKTVNAGIFDISVADGNGWIQNKKGVYYPSKRSKLIIRLPKNKLEDCQQLLGKTLDLNHYQIKVVKMLKPKTFSGMPTLLAKHVVCDDNMAEDDFLQAIYTQLQALNIQVKKMMAGLESNIKTDRGIIHTRSLMLADLNKQDAVLLQEKGIGHHQLLGCGLFVPQKNIETLDNS